MSFEDDVMSLANEVKDRAVWRTVTKKEGEKTDLYARGGPEGYYQHVLELFRPYSQLPDPARHRAIAGQVAVALARVSTGGDNKDPLHLVPANTHLALITGSGSSLTTWTGRAAQDFNQLFIAPFHYIASNQYMLGAVLHGAIEAQALMWENARKDILGIGAATLKALYEGEPFWCCNNRSGAEAVLTAISAIATVAAPFTDGASLAVRVGVEAVAAAAGAGANLVHEDKETTHVGGQYTWDIVASMANSIRRLDEQIQRGEEKVLNAMRATQGVIDQNVRAFVANRPNLAGANAGNIKDPQYMGQARDAL